MVTLSPRRMPMRFRQRVVPVVVSSFGHREDDGGRGADQVEEFRLRPAVALGIEFDGVVRAAAAQRHLLCRRMREIDGVAGLEADLDFVEPALELLGDILGGCGRSDGKWIERGAAVMSVIATNVLTPGAATPRPSVRGVTGPWSVPA